MKNKFNIASIDIDCKAESFRILNFYTRYMLKKFKFPNMIIHYLKLVQDMKIIILILMDF